jgi:hypothetical protein
VLTIEMRSRTQKGCGSIVHVWLSNPVKIVVTTDYKANEFVMDQYKVMDESKVTFVLLKAG